MEMLQPYLPYIYAALGILALVLFVVVLVKLLGGSVRGKRGSRLGISEYYEIDKTRRLVLVRRDETEHLVLIGGAQDVVIESGIGSPLMAVPAAPQPPRIQPRPAVFGNRRPTLRPVEPSMRSPDDDEQ
jgi:flagellar biogenesis protein FliO